jgi:signal transduction histidine kinase
LERRDHHAVLIIEDDGVGFHPDDNQLAESGFGMSGMRERTALIGAEFEVESHPEKGTTIYVKVPLNTRQAAGEKG